MNKANTASDTDLGQTQAIETVFVVDGVLDDQAFVGHNKGVIIAALKKAGVESAVASYYGEGDDGQSPTVEFIPSNEEAAFATVTFKELRSTFDTDKNDWHRTVVDKTTNLEEAIVDFTDHLITMHGHDGYQDGDGGGGSVTLTTASDSVEHDHFDNIVETAHEIHEL